jgi:hypothetical protein
VIIGPSAITAESNGPTEVDGFRVQSRNRTSSGEQEAKKREGPHTYKQSKREFKAETRKYFAPLR